MEIKLLGNKHKRNRIKLSRSNNYSQTFKNLNFTIDSWSSYISHFHPSNILIDNNSTVSKWSVDFKTQSEYVILKLEKPSIVKSITFGKFKDPTNMKEFKVYAGLDANEFVEILHSWLSYDNEYESFTVNSKTDGEIPCK